MFELKGYAAIVTGGARGIGRAIALALADAGADVLITYKGNTAAADAVVAEISVERGSPSRLMLPTQTLRLAWWRRRWRRSARSIFW
jgi:NAD(P)-dependent dehydrogenase (short-subunit alcohol dehydrogenase family)